MMHAYDEIYLDDAMRNLGEAFDFDVTWDAANSCIMIDTTSSYTAD